MSHFRAYMNMYTFETVLPGNGEKVVYKPVTTGQLKKVLMFETSKDPDVMEKALDEIINECVVKPENFDAESLYLQDRFYLLLEIRKATKGSRYTFESVCTSCSSQTQQVLNLSSLPIVKLDIAPHKKPVKKLGKIREVTDEPKEEESVSDWNVIKINKDISVRVKITTRKMQRDVLDLINRETDLTDMQKMAKMSTLLYAEAIEEIITPVGIDKDLSLEERSEFIDSLLEKDIELISDWFEKHKFGVEFKFDIKCLHCGYKEVKEIPLESFFF